MTARIISLNIIGILALFLSLKVSASNTSVSTSIDASDCIAIEGATDDFDRTSYTNVLFNPIRKESKCTHKFTLKTNAPAWLMLWANVIPEFDISDHVSVQIPIYYSGLDYFKRNIKFRTFSVIPEVRFWTRDINHGFFTNLHIGFGWYNVAWGTSRRWQDHAGHSPAVGGGIGVGYRFNFCSDKRWIMEAGIGAGAYYLDYDIFENKHNGLITGRHRRTLFCIDQAFLTIGYTFDYKKKGGGR